MIIRENFSKFAAKKAILLGAVSLLLIGSGVAATQASFNDSGDIQVTAESASMMVWEWGIFDSIYFNDILPNQVYTDSGTFTNLCNCNIETVATIDMTKVSDPAILDATTITLKMNGTTVYNGNMRSLNSVPYRTGPVGSIPIELSINITNINSLTKAHILNSVPIKFTSISVPPL